MLFLQQTNFNGIITQQFGKLQSLLITSFIFSNSTVPVIDSEEEIYQSEDGYYNITSILRYETDYLEKEVGFICDLVIPETEYHRSKTIYYYPGK